MLPIMPGDARLSDSWCFFFQSGPFLCTYYVYVINFFLFITFVFYTLGFCIMHDVDIFDFRILFKVMLFVIFVLGNVLHLLTHKLSI